MKNFYKSLIAIFLAAIVLMPYSNANAGNKDRSGEAGAGELLINPWARSAGWGGVNVSNVRGLEGTFNNIAGVAHTKQTDINFTYTSWLQGSGITLMAAGIAFKAGESSAFTLAFQSMSFGDIEITTVDQPEGGLGTFSPTLMAITLGYAKAFSNSIFGGMSIKIISESIKNASAMGVAVDLGIQYVTGELENIHFGISLRNVGPGMKFSGDGYSLSTAIPGKNNLFTMTQRGAAFEIPTQLNIGAAYDFLFDIGRFTAAGNFTSNAFTKDQFTVGGEFSFKELVLLRVGYAYEDGIWDDISDPEKTNANKGLSAGLTVQIPLNKEKTKFIGIDYTYIPTSSFSSTNMFAVRIDL